MVPKWYKTIFVSYYNPFMHDSSGFGAVVVSYVREITFLVQFGLILGQFGPIWAYLVYFGAKTFFFQKSENVTFLDLLKANLMQKIRKI